MLRPPSDCPSRPTRRWRAWAVTATLGVALTMGVGVGSGAAAGATPAALSPASPSTCPTQSVEVSVRRAQAVFTGTVAARTEAPVADDPTATDFTQTVDVERVYRGRVSSSVVTVQSQRIRRQCSQGGLAVGSDYVFFVDGDGETWAAAGGAGTTVATSTLVAEVEALLGSGRQPTAPRPPSATFTEADVSDPVRLSRAAAPGVALVIVGLLGLLVAGRVGRRSA